MKGASYLVFCSKGLLSVMAIRQRRARKEGEERAAESPTDLEQLLVANVRGILHLGYLKWDHEQVLRHTRSAADRSLRIARKWLFAFLVEALAMYLMGGHAYLYNTTFGPFPVTGADFASGVVHTGPRRYVQFVPKKALIDLNTVSEDVGWTHFKGKKKPLARYMSVEVPEANNNLLVRVPTSVNEAMNQRLKLNFKAMKVSTLKCILERMGVGEKEVAGFFDKWELEERAASLYSPRLGVSKIKLFNNKVLVRCGILVGWMTDLLDASLTRGRSFGGVLDTAEPYSSAALTSFTVLYCVLIALCGEEAVRNGMLGFRKRAVYKWLQIYQNPKAVSMNALVEMDRLSSAKSTDEKIREIAQILASKNMDKHSQGCLFVNENFVVMTGGPVLDADAHQLRLPPSARFDLMVISTQRICYVGKEGFYTGTNPSLFKDLRGFEHFDHEWLTEKLKDRCAQFASDWQETKRKLEETWKKEEEEARLQELEEKYLKEEEAHVAELRRRLQTDPEVGDAGPLQPTVPEEIARLRARAFDAKTESGDVCVICQAEVEEGETVVAFPCTHCHIFHEECLVEWLRKKHTCPICRHGLQHLDLIPRASFTTLMRFVRLLTERNEEGVPHLLFRRLIDQTEEDGEF